MNGGSARCEVSVRSFIELLLLNANVEGGFSSVELRTPKQESAGLNPLCCRFKAWAFSYSPHCPSSLNCTNEYLAIGGG